MSRFSVDSTLIRLPGGEAPLVFGMAGAPGMSFAAVDRAARRVYVGFGSGALHGDRAAEMPVHLVLEQEKIRRLVERLKGPEAAGAAAELLGRGPDAIPALIEALERRDVELRRQAFQILQTILQGAATFDPYAPEAQRRQQIASLREQYDRKAG